MLYRSHVDNRSVLGPTMRVDVPPNRVPLRVSYYSIQEKYEELNPALIDLYDAYKAYLQRIEDFAQPTDLGAEINLNNELRLE